MASPERQCDAARLARALVSDHARSIRASVQAFVRHTVSTHNPYTQPKGARALRPVEHTHGALLLGAQLPADLYARALDACAGAPTYETLQGLYTLAIVPLTRLRALARALNARVAWQCSKDVRRGSVRVLCVAAWGDEWAAHTEPLTYARVVRRHRPPRSPARDVRQERESVRRVVAYLEGLRRK